MKITIMGIMVGVKTTIMVGDKTITTMVGEMKETIQTTVGVMKITMDGDKIIQTTVGITITLTITMETTDGETAGESLRK